MNAATGAIMNVSRQKEIAGCVRVADTFWTRLKGLLGTQSLPDGTALIIRPCNSVHTFGMKYPLDVLFVSKGGRVRKVAENLLPGRLAWDWGAAWVIELPAGTAAATATACGDQLDWLREK